MSTIEEFESRLDQIVAASGGLSNFSEIGCCATRLRLSFVDPSLVRVECLGKVEGCAGVVVRGGEYQLVVGIAASRLCRLLRLRTASHRMSTG